MDLERTIAHLLDVPSSRAVVATSSGTSALFALLGVLASRTGRRMRWLASAFGFAATRIGPLAGSVRLIDCDDEGMLDLGSVAAIPGDDWDGLLLTNVFGRCADFSAYVTFCHDRDKAIVVDNAQGLLGSDRGAMNAPEEIISFHHTKPWGFGEGGCAIVDREDEAMLRGLLNFGYSTPRLVDEYAANGKIADLAAAAIVARLEGWPRAADNYRIQWQRIASIAEDVGYDVFSRPATGGTLGFVPILAPSPVEIETVRSSALPLAKYYPPLGDLPTARRLYARIVCVACHPGLGILEDGLISKGLKALRDQSPPGATL